MFPESQLWVYSLLQMLLPLEGCRRRETQLEMIPHREKNDLADTIGYVL